MPSVNAEILFGAEESHIQSSQDGIRIHLAIPILHGCARQELGSSNRFEAVQYGHFHLLRDSETLMGAACLRVTSTPEAAASTLYQELLDSLDGYQLLRIWNYVPGINVAGPGIENYRSFCMGRSHQFALHNLPMCSASAVGIGGDSLVVYFIATREPVRHWENPEQVPAYRYPSQYGPRSPSFSRASAVSRAERTSVYISGTASIKGHESLHIGKLDKQLATTLDNIRIMKEQTLGDTADVPSDNLLSETCIYLRRAEDLEEMLRLLEALGIASDRFRILHADICRADLLVEIETQQPL